jgi:hypothetical protein
MAEPLRLPYTAVTDARGETTLRPLLRLALSYSGPTVEASGLLDTGADVNVLPYPLGADLGIVWDEQSPLAPPSGNLSRYEARGVVLSATVGSFAPVRLAFAWTRAENVPLILGQVNFFVAFDVCFFRSRGLFEIQPTREA